MHIYVEGIPNFTLRSRWDYSQHFTNPQPLTRCFASRRSLFVDSLKCDVQVWEVKSDGKKVYKIKKHHEESWVELFIDLIYVGLFITLSINVKACSKTDGLSSELFVTSATLILLMFTFRISIDSFSNRFLSDDLFGRLLYLVYAYGLAMIVLDVSGTDEQGCHKLGTVCCTAFLYHLLMCASVC